MAWRLVISLVIYTGSDWCLIDSLVSIAQRCFGCFESACKVIHNILLDIFPKRNKVRYSHIENIHSAVWKTENPVRYSEIPLLRPPKIKTSYLLKTLFAKFRLFFSWFSTPSVSLIRDHLWDRPKVVLKTVFGWSQRWS